MYYPHGIITSEASPAAMSEEVGGGIHVVIGLAPVNLAVDPYGVTNKPVIVKSFEEAKELFGYSKDFEKFGISEAMFAYFEVANIAPVVFINVLDPAKHKAEVNITVTGIIETDVPSDVVIPEGYELVKVLEADDIVYGVNNVGQDALADGAYRASYPYVGIPVYKGYTYRIEVESDAEYTIILGAVIAPPEGATRFETCLYDSKWIGDTSTPIEIDVVPENTNITDISRVAWLHPAFKKEDSSKLVEGDIKRVIISRKYIEGAETGVDEWETVRILTTNDIVYGAAHYGDAQANTSRASYPYLDIPAEVGYVYYIETETNVDYPIQHAGSITDIDGATDYTEFVFDTGWEYETDTPFIVNVTDNNSAWLVICYRKPDNTEVEQDCIKTTIIKRRKV